MRQWVRRAAAATGILAMYFTTGCAGFFVYPGSLTGSGTGNGDYVYVANATTETVAGFQVGSGTLTAVTGSPYTLSFRPTAAVVDATYSILYVAGSFGIYAYSIGSSGQLTALNNGTAVAFAGAASMAVSPDGQWLLVLDANNITLDEFQINSSNGALTQQGSLVTYPVPTGVTAVARQVTFAPNGDCVFLAIETAGYVVYPFTTSNGALSTPLTPQSLVSGTAYNAVAVTPNSDYLYAAVSGTGGGLAAYSIGSGCGLTALNSGTLYTTGTQPFSVVVNNSGTDVYVANQTGGNISGYSIASANGTLTALSGSPFSSNLGSAPVALAVDKSGAYLLAVANGGGPDLSMYSFDSGTPGALDFSTDTTTGTDPTNPVAIAATH